MSRLDRWLGMVRSLAIYHAIPFRQRRFHRLYGAFVQPGDLVFDIGGHVGNRARAFAALGCRVVTVEPQPDFARLLRRLFAGRDEITVVESAVSRAPGRTLLAVSDRHPTVTTINTAWRDAHAGDDDFAQVRWNRQIEVEVTTLDLLIGRFGLPRFVKIDVEGAEPSVLAGLSQPIPALSFEYLPRALDEARAALARLRSLAAYEFNVVVGEEGTFASARWMNEADLLVTLAGPVAQRRPGDVYARMI